MAAKSEVESSLESLFDELVSPPVLQPIQSKPEIPVVEAKQEAEPSLEDLFSFSELPTLEIPQPLTLQSEVPVTEVQASEASLEDLFGEPASSEDLFGELASSEDLFGELASSEDLFGELASSEDLFGELASSEDLFGELASSEDLPPIHLVPEMPIAEAMQESEPSLEDLFAIVPETSEETTLFGEAPREEVLMSSLEALFESEPASTEPPAPKPSFVSLMANAPEGAAIFAGALPLASKLEWICAESPEVIHGLLAEQFPHLECRVLYCPPREMSRAELATSLQDLPEQLSLKVGFGLPEGHSLFLLTDTENNRIFYHQPPAEAAILVESWSEAGATEIDWRQERFEMLWEDRLRPHVHVETLSDSLETLFANS
jgi:hypothetical protein